VAAKGQKINKKATGVGRTVADKISKGLKGQQAHPEKAKAATLRSLFLLEM
jgi:hypothetical protein